MTFQHISRHEEWEQQKKKQSSGQSWLQRKEDPTALPRHEAPKIGQGFGRSASWLLGASKSSADPPILQRQSTNDEGNVHPDLQRSNKTGLLDRLREEQGMGTTKRVVQRTTKEDVQASATGLTERVTRFANVANDIPGDAATSIGDIDAKGDHTYKRKFHALNTQLNGHLSELEYGLRKVSDEGGVKFGKYVTTVGMPAYGGLNAVPDTTRGADVTAPRREEAQTTMKAVQLKVYHGEEPGAVDALIRSASAQLSATNTSGEVPEEAAQRVILIILENEYNPYPYQATETKPVPMTETALGVRLYNRVKDYDNEINADKIKVQYSNGCPYSAADGRMFKSITLKRLGGLRYNEDFRGKSAHRVTRAKFSDMQIEY